MKSPERKHLRMRIFYKNKDSGSKDRNKNNFRFISPAMAANVNNLFFHGKMKFHYEKISFRVSCKHPLLRYAITF